MERRLPIRANRIIKGPHSGSTPGILYLNPADHSITVQGDGVTSVVDTKPLSTGGLTVPLVSGVSSAAEGTTRLYTAYGSVSTLGTVFPAEWSIDYWWFDSEGNLVSDTFEYNIVMPANGTSVVYKVYSIDPLGNVSEPNVLTVTGTASGTSDGTQFTAEYSDNWPDTVYAGVGGVFTMTVGTDAAGHHLTAHINNHPGVTFDRDTVTGTTEIAYTVSKNRSLLALAIAIPVPLYYNGVHVRTEWLRSRVAENIGLSNLDLDDITVTLPALPVASGKTHQISATFEGRDDLVFIYRSNSDTVTIDGVDNREYQAGESCDFFVIDDSQNPFTLDVMAVTPWGDSVTKTVALSVFSTDAINMAPCTMVIDPSYMLDQALTATPFTEATGGVAPLTYEWSIVPVAPTDDAKFQYQSGLPDPITIDSSNATHFYWSSGSHPGYLGYYTRIQVTATDANNDIGVKVFELGPLNYGTNPISASDAVITATTPRGPDQTAVQVKFKVDPITRGGHSVTPKLALMSTTNGSYTSIIPGGTIPNDTDQPFDINKQDTNDTYAIRISAEVGYQQFYTENFIADIGESFTEDDVFIIKSSAGTRGYNHVKEHNAENWTWGSAHSGEATMYAVVNNAAFGTMDFNVTPGVTKFYSGDPIKTMRPAEFIIPSPVPNAISEVYGHKLWIKASHTGEVFDGPRCISVVIACKSVDGSVTYWESPNLRDYDPADEAVPLERRYQGGWYCLEMPGGDTPCEISITSQCTGYFFHPVKKSMIVLSKNNPGYVTGSGTDGYFDCRPQDTYDYATNGVFHRNTDATESYVRLDFYDDSDPNVVVATKDVSFRNTYVLPWTYASGKTVELEYQVWDSLTPAASYVEPTPVSIVSTSTTISGGMPVYSIPASTGLSNYWTVAIKIVGIEDTPREDHIDVMWGRDRSYAHGDTWNGCRMIVPVIKNGLGDPSSTDHYKVVHARLGETVHFNVGSLPDTDPRYVLFYLMINEKIRPCLIKLNFS